ncbi:MAG: hypothetical protein PIR53_19775 [Nocardioides alkalitolerans]
MTSRTATFASVAAQADNLGDAELRAVAVAMLDAPGTDLHVYTGGMPGGYLRCLELPAGVLTHRRRLTFATALLRNAARRPVNFVLSPGPYVVPRGASVAKSWLLLALVLLVRARGGAVLALGRAVHTGGRTAPLPERLVARRTRIFVVRDASSALAFGEPALELMPDLALAVDRRPPDDGPREDVVISLRGDKAVSGELAATLAEQIRAAGFTPVFVTQVMRDDELHARLAEQTGADAILWGSNDHDVQLERVRAALSRAAWVVTDRLHAAIFGLQCGAAPVAVVGDPGKDKVVKCLDRLLPLPQVSRTGPTLLSEVFDDVRRKEALTAAGRARGDLLELSTRVRTAVSPEPEIGGTRD